MDSKSAVKNIVTALLQQRYFSLRKEIIKGLQHSSINPKLFSEALTSSLTYSRLNCGDLVEELRQKALAGQNGDVAERKFNARVKRSKDYIASIAKKSYTIQDILDNIDTCPLFTLEDGTPDPEMEHFKSYFVESITSLEPKETDSAIAPIVASIVKAKVSGDISLENLDEYEKVMEPLVIAMIETNKGKHKHIYVDSELKVGALKSQVIEMTNKALEKLGRDNTGATKYFHDLSLINYVSAIPTKSETIPTGITTTTNSPMYYIDEDGTTKRLLGNATFIADKGICDLLEQGDKDGKFSAIRKIQGKLSPASYNAETGEINSAFSNSEKLAEELLSILFIADGLGLELSEDFVFALANPLNKELFIIEDEDAINNVVGQALGLAKEVLSEERGIDYSPELKLAEEADARAREFKRRVDSAPAIVKRTGAELKLAAFAEVKKLIERVIDKEYSAVTQRELEKLKTSKENERKAKKDSSKSAEAKAEIAAGQTKAAEDALAKKNAVEQLLKDLGKTGNTKYIKQALGLLDSDKPLKPAKGTLTLEEIEEIIQLLQELDVADFEGDQKAWNAKKKEISGSLEDAVKNIVHNMPNSPQELADRAAKKAVPAAEDSAPASDGEGEA